MGMNRTSHPSPESYGGARKDAAEALTGEDAGEPLSRERTNSGLPTSFLRMEGNTGMRDKVSPLPSPRGRRPSACIEASWMGTERSPDPVDGASRQRRAEKANGRTAAMHGQGKSDECVVPEKPANEARPLWVWVKEQAEGRRSAKRNLGQDNTSRALYRIHGVPPVLAWVRAKPGMLPRHHLKARAVCGKSARTDPCGGAGRKPPASYRDRQPNKNANMATLAIAGFDLGLGAIAVVIAVAVILRVTAKRNRDESQDYWARQHDRLERIVKLLEPAAKDGKTKAGVEGPRPGDSVEK